MKIVIFILAWIAVIAVLCIINKAVCDMKAEADEQALKDLETDKLMTCQYI